jgi:RNA polymerase sigma-70 factor (ECF subfamily)
MQPGEEALKQWMVMGLAGDGAAHGQLLRALVPILRGFYRRRMGAQEEIEDLLQETLIAVHTRRATYDVARPFTSWLFAVARYKMIDHFRQGGRTCAIEGLEDILAAEGFAEASDAAADVERLLETIPPNRPPRSGPRGSTDFPPPRPRRTSIWANPTSRFPCIAG